jgi:polyphenol oxidase
MSTSASWIPANWPAPSQIRAGTSTRRGGVSSAPYAEFNLAVHVGDSRSAVSHNRQHLSRLLKLPSEPCWLDQYHSAVVIDPAAEPDTRHADGAWTDRVDTVCAVLTADCLPLLLCNSAGTEIAAVHCGWRGLAGGIIASALARMYSPPTDLLAWLGPAIGPAHYEIDQSVYTAFQPQLSRTDSVFQATRPGHWRLDLYAAAKQLLHAAGLRSIYGGERCTYRDSDRFYSYRRDGETGRMASLIWIAGQERHD